MMIDALKALADGNRLKILEQLAQSSKCVCDLEAELGLPQNLVSHHLAVLKTAGLVDDCRCGKRNFYSLRGDKMKEIAKVFNAMGASNED